MLNYSEIEKLYYKACCDVLENHNEESDFSPDEIDILIRYLTDYCDTVISEVTDEVSDEEAYVFVLNCIHRRMKIIHLTKTLRKNLRFKSKDSIIKQYFSFRQKRLFNNKQKDVIIDILLNNDVQSRIYSMNDAYNYANVHFKEVEIAKYEKAIKSHRLSPKDFNMAFEVKPNNCDTVLVLCNIDRQTFNVYAEKTESLIVAIPIYKNKTTDKISASTRARLFANAY